MAKNEFHEYFDSTYLLNVKLDQESNIKSYFQELAQSPHLNKRKKLFDLAGTHESNKCRKWAVDIIRTNTLSEYKKDYVRYWILTPFINLRKVIEKFIESIELENEIVLRTAVYLLLNRPNDAQKLHNGFELLEKFIQEDPILYAPISERLTKIRKNEIQRVTSDRAIVLKSIIESDSYSEQIPLITDSISRALRTEDWDLAWNILKQSNFACITESLQYFKLADWEPKLIRDKELFNNLIEFIGFDGWKSCKEIMQETIIDKEMRYQGIIFSIETELLRPPPQKAINKVTNITIDSFSLPGMQKTYKTVFSNEIPITQLIIPNIFDIEIDEIGISAILGPIGLMNHEEYAWTKERIKELKISKDYYERKVLRYFLAIEKLADYQAKFRFNYHTKEKEIDDYFLKENGFDINLKSKVNDVIIGFDFGNTNTAISIFDIKNHKFLPGKDFIKKGGERIFNISDDGVHLPSLIHYKSGGKKLIGLEAENLFDENETFKLMKRNLRRGWLAGLKVEENRVRVPEAIDAYLCEIMKYLEISNLTICKFAFSVPVDAPTQYQETLKSCFQNSLSSIGKNIDLNTFEIYDEATASIIGLQEDVTADVPILVIDIGGGTTDIAVIVINGDKPSSQIFSRLSKDLGGADIEGTSFYCFRDEVDEDIPKKSENITKFKDAKHTLSEIPGNHEFEINGTNVILTKEKINNWLYEENFIERYTNLLSSANERARINGCDNIEQVVLMGGGSKWPLFNEITKNSFKNADFFHKPEIFAVARGTAKASTGLSIRTTNPYRIGLLNSKGDSINFETIFEIGTIIPSKPLEITFNPEEPISEIEFDIRRKRIKIGDEKFLLFGREGVPHLRKSDSFIIYEPLQEESTSLNVNDTYLIWINEKGYIKLRNQNSGIIKNLGSVL